MHILIIGAAGMVGRKLTERLVADGHLGGNEVTVLTLVARWAPGKTDHPHAEPAQAD